MVIKISLLEMLKSLCPKDQEELLKVFFIPRSNLDSNGKLLRTTGTISKNAPIEEVRQCIEQMFSLPKGALKNWNPPSEAFKGAYDNFKKVLAIIDAQKKVFLKDSKILLSKYEELEHTGKFIVALDENISIETQEEVLEFPDFILNYNDKRVGLEHTRLIEGFSNAVISRIKGCLERAKQMIIEEMSGVTGNINIYLVMDVPVVNGKNLQDLTITKAESYIVAREIADYLKREMNGDSSAKPVYIHQTIIGSNPGISLDITFGQKYLPEQDTKAAAIVADRIADKEAKCLSYISRHSFDEMWLLIAMDGIKQSSGFKLNGVVVPNKIRSRFNRVFVFDAFDYTIKEIETDA